MADRLYLAQSEKQSVNNFSWRKSSTTGPHPFPFQEIAPEGMCRPGSITKLQSPIGHLRALTDTS
jgi:hypothetical protein